MVPTSLVDIIEDLRSRLAAGDDAVELVVADPDLGRGLYPGERIDVRGQTFPHRPLRVWVELADRLELRLHTPQPAGDGLVRLRFERIDPPTRTPVGDPTEKYGRESEFARISKLEDPGFVIDLDDALRRAHLGPTPRVLDLGCNTAEVLDLVARLRPQATFVGIDHSASALEIARARHPDHQFIHSDLAALPELALPRFDLVLALCTLQSPGVDDRVLLRHVVQERLAAHGSVILGVPNCRYRDGEVLHGARMKNFRQPDLSLVIKHVGYFKKYLQQHRRRVFITGRNYILVTGVPSGGAVHRDPGWADSAD
jgi:SAM-dependent methyltransferase